ncbi:hypothetical protein AB0M34_35530 [Nocardia sp. NPDC050193]
MTRKSGAWEVIAWQTGTARLLPRMLAGRRSGPLFLTDRKARPSVATNDVDSVTGRARLSYRRARAGEGWPGRAAATRWLRCGHALQVAKYR